MVFLTRLNAAYRRRGGEVKVKVKVKVKVARVWAIKS
jgi:hypothetical protein